jgi:hypothetical protein
MRRRKVNCYMPVPVRFMVWGLSAAVSVIVMAPA